MQNGEGHNHIDSSDPIPPPPPPPPPLMPPPPPPPLLPDSRGQQDDLLDFQDEGCQEPCLKPFTPESEPDRTFLPGTMDSPEDPNDPVVSSSDEAGFGVPLHSGYVPPPVPPPPLPEPDPESPTAMELPEPDMENLPPEEDDDEEEVPLPPDSLQHFSASGRLPEQNDTDVSPAEDFDTNRHSVGHTSLGSADREVSETQYPPADSDEYSPSQPEPEPEPEPVPVPPAPYVPPLPPPALEPKPEPEPEPAPREEEPEQEMSPPTWSDEPPVAKDYPPPGPTSAASYPEEQASPIPVYPPIAAELGAPEVEGPPAYTEKSPPPDFEPVAEEGEPAMEVEERNTGPYYGKQLTHDVPVEVAAMAAATAATATYDSDGSPTGGESSPPQSPQYPPGSPQSPPYDMNASPHHYTQAAGGMTEPPRQDHVHAPQATTYVIPPQASYDVIDEEQGQQVGAAVVVSPEEQKGAGGSRCCEKCVGCLSHVPCGSLVAWILLVLGLGALAGSLLVGVRKTRTLVHDDRLLWFLELTVTGVAVSMFVLGTLFLIVSHLSSEPTCGRVFSSPSRNSCGRGLNIFLLVFVYILFVAWMLVSAVLTTPVVLLVVIFLVIGRLQPGQCLDLHNYGFPARKICFPELHSFEDDAQDVLICYGVAFFSAILIVISLVHFLICLSANLSHLKDNRFTPLATYDTDEEHNAKHAMLDTNM